MSHINISLDYNDATLQLQIADDGIGFDATETSTTQSGMGLQNIRKRAGIIGGRVTIQSTPGEGTEVALTMPMPPPNPSR